MKRVSLLIICFIILSSTTVITAQHRFNINSNNHVPSPAMHYPPLEHNLNIPQEETPPSIPYLQAESRTNSADVIGTTIYDLQTNGSILDRFSRNADGTMAASWTMGFTPAGGYPNRGSGYNSYDGSDWDEIPTQRLESQRCGWPNLTTTSDGLECVLSHANATNPYSMSVMTRAAGEADWTESNFGFDTPTGILWPHSTIGGPNGNTVHAIAITTPTGLATNGGAIYEGMDGKLLYYRSLDGGLNWDITDQELPGLTSEFYGFISADSYTVSSKGNTLVIAVFHSWGDVAIWKSEDNGSSFTKTIIRDFPIDGYMADDGYAFDDLDGAFDTLTYPDSLAIYSTDGAGCILIDNNDMVHIAFGDMYVLDNVLNDDNTSYFPGISGISYWNESFGPNFSLPLDVVDDALDRNGNDTLDIDGNNIALYFTSMTSHPTMSVDSDNNIYLLYSGIMENFIQPDDNQHFRHLLITKSTNSGASWEDVKLVDTLVSDAIPLAASAIYEFVYPQMHSVVDDNVHIIFQRDFRPGISVAGDEDDETENEIVYISFDKNFDIINSVETLSPTQFDFSMSPNPTNTNLYINYSLKQSNDVNIQVFDLLGKQLMETNLLQKSVGDHNEILNVSHLSSGLYLIQMKVGNELLTQKLVVE